MKKTRAYAFALPIIFCIVAFTTASEAPSAAPTDEERRAERRVRILQAIEEQRTRPPVPSDGAIVRPGESVRLPESQDSEMIVVFDGEQVRQVAHIYAAVTGKEILVSSRVGLRPIKMNNSRGNPQYIRTKIEDALRTHGVTIIQAGEYSIALVE